MAIQRLDQILEKIIGWENQLESCYEHMEKSLKNEQARKTVELLKERHLRNSEVFDSIHINDYKNSEFIKNAPEYTIKEDYCQCEISDDTGAEDLLFKILRFEEEIEKYYTHLRDVLVYARSKELFDMLKQYKMGQIKAIKALMDSLDLVM